MRGPDTNICIIIEHGIVFGGGGRRRHLGDVVDGHIVLETGRIALWGHVDDGTM